jgi:hypothetical protein
MFEGMVDRALSRTQVSPLVTEENRIALKAAAAHAGVAAMSSSGIHKIQGSPGAKK